jgi:hypothetical protein
MTNSVWTVISFNYVAEYDSNSLEVFDSKEKASDYVINLIKAEYDDIVTDYESLYAALEVMFAEDIDEIDMSNIKWSDVKKYVVRQLNSESKCYGLADLCYKINNHTIN